MTETRVLAVEIITPARKSERLLLIDIFRIFCVFFIVVYHTWILFIGLESTQSQPYLFFRFFEITRSFFFDRAGLWVAITSFFLFGYLASKLYRWRIPFFIFGMLATQYVGESDADFLKLNNYIWGVFSFVLSGYLILVLTEKISQFWRTGVHLLLSSLLIIPHSLFRVWLDFIPSGYLKQALIGDYLYGQIPTGWFLLPWLGFILLSFEVGTWLRLWKSKIQNWQLTLDWLFSFIVLSSLVVLILRGPGFSLGPMFNQVIFWVEPPDLAFTVLFPIWIFRMAQLKKIQNLLETSKLTKKISELCWNQHFWFCHILHLTLFYLLQTSIPDRIIRQPLILQLLPFIILMSTEFIGRRFFEQLKKFPIRRLAR